MLKDLCGLRGRLRVQIDDGGTGPYAAPDAGGAPARWWEHSGLSLSFSFSIASEAWSETFAGLSRRGSSPSATSPWLTSTLEQSWALRPWCAGLPNLANQCPPEHFIAAAETKGFVGEITRVVITCVTEEIDDLLKLDDFTATVNITTQDLCDPAFFQFVEQCVKSSRIVPHSLGFELTERSTADRDVVIHAIERLRSLGHPVYIDDFGTGYSSLAYLQDLKVSAIKIDRAFTNTVGTEAVTASVVPQILDMASRLNLMVVVEGIETQRQADYFRSAHPGIRGQGWLFGRPVPAAHFKRLFSDSLSSARHDAELNIA